MPPIIADKCEAGSLVLSRAEERALAHISKRAELAARYLSCIFVREKIAAFKVPRHFTVIDALPRNNVGKVLKRELRLLKTR